MNEMNGGISFETARIGFFDKYDVFVVTDDVKNVPHFHIRDKETKGLVFHTAIMIKSPEYCFHNKKEQMLSKSDIEKLICFLNSVHSDRHYTKCSNWEYLLAIWNDNNAYQLSGLSLEMPNYNLLLNCVIMEDKNGNK